MPYTEEKRIIEVNGVRLHLAALGEGKPVLLLHGNGESHEIFDVTMRQLAEAGYRVYAPDSRGQGANEPLNEYHYADMAADMAALIPALGIEGCAFYGFSDGGIVGLLLALEHPELLRCLAVSGANLEPDGVTAELSVLLEQMQREAPNPLITLMQTEPHIDPAALAAIPFPVLVTAGEHDLILPAETRRIAEHLPNAQLVIVPDADHGSYIEHSPIIGELLIDFLARYM